MIHRTASVYLLNMIQLAATVFLFCSYFLCKIEIAVEIILVLQHLCIINSCRNDHPVFRPVILKGYGCCNIRTFLKFPDQIIRNGINSAGIVLLSLTFPQLHLSSSKPSCVVLAFCTVVQLKLCVC